MFKENESKLKALKKISEKFFSKTFVDEISQKLTRKKMALYA